jgi:hypothetical protein
MRDIVIAASMVAFGVLFTLALCTVVEQLGSQRPAQTFDPMFDAIEHRPPISSSSQGQDVCTPPQRAFKLGSPFKQRPPREPMVNPTPTSPSQVHPDSFRG